MTKLTMLTTLLLILVYSTNANIVKRSNPITVESTENIVDDAGDADEQDLLEFKNLIRKYTGNDPFQPVPDQSSTDGSGATKESDIRNTPAFMNEIAKIQKSSGLPVTGKLTKAVVTQAKRPRCGMPETTEDGDGPAAFTAASSKWSEKYDVKTKLTYLTYSVSNQNLPTDFSYSEFKEGVVAAMCMWEKVSNIRFEKETSQRPDIKINFGAADHGDNFSFDGPGGTLAHAFYPSNGMLHFDKDESWYLAQNGQEENKRKKDIFTVCAHEVGHNLGLRHSSASHALMAAYYDFQGSYHTYTLPQDDVLGINSLYNEKIPSDLFKESRENACKTLKRVYKYDSNAKPTPTSKPKKTAKPTTTTTTTKRPYKTAKPTKDEDDNTCKDDKDLGKYCPSWKRSGYCTEETQAASMRRRCPLTCGTCGGKVPAKPPTIPTKPKTVCDIQKMDSVTTFYDSNGFYDSYHFKDNYYVRTYSHFNKKTSKTINHLTKDFDVQDTSLFRFYSDPKSYITGSMKYKKRDMFSKTMNLKALIAGRSFYLTFEDDETGRVNQYTRGSPTMTYVGFERIQTMFPGYPHKKVHATYTEIVNYEYRYTLFYGDRYWQYTAKSPGDLFDKTSKAITKFEAVINQTNSPIKNWHGVHACNIDSVFQYEGEPYFLKNNLFWPAKIDGKSAHVARDIRYYFYRCSDAPSQTYSTPISCSSKNARGGGSSSLVSFHVITFIFITFLTNLLQN